MPFIPQVTIGMSTFLTYGIYSINTSSQIPTQSEYLPMVTLFFVMSSFYTLISFTWFLAENFLRSRFYMPPFLVWYVEKLRMAERFLVEKTKALVNKIKKIKFSCNKQNATQVEPIEKLQVTVEKDDKRNEKEKKPDKETFNRNIDYLNHHIFYIILFTMICSNLVIWISLGS